MVKKHIKILIIVVIILLVIICTVLINRLKSVTNNSEKYNVQIKTVSFTPDPHEQFFINNENDAVRAFEKLKNRIFSNGVPKDYSFKYSSTESTDKYSKPNIADRYTVYVMTEYYKDVEVYDKTIRISTDKETGELCIIKGNYITFDNFSIKEKISKDKAVEILNSYFSNSQITSDKVSDKAIIYDNNKLILGYYCTRMLGIEIVNAKNGEITSMLSRNVIIGKKEPTF